MKSTIRIIAALSLFAVAACAGKMDQVATADEVTQFMTVGALKVSMADNAPSGNVYEYSSPVTAPAPQPMKYGVANGNVFEYH
jgi:hypothetical protein